MRAMRISMRSSPDCCGGAWRDVDAPENHSLKVFLDTKRAGVQGEDGGELGLDADELRVLESALA